MILLMFGVGMHFSLADLRSVQSIAIPGAIVQIIVATVLGTALAAFWDWPLASGIVFGLALSVASTVVMLTALEQRGRLDSVHGRIAVGWLIVEDVAMVVALVILPVIAASTGPTAGATPIDVWQLGRGLGIALLKIVVFFIVIHHVGVRLFPWLFAQVANAGSRELITLFVIGVALGIAYGSAIVLERPLQVAGVIVIVVAGKSFAALLIVLAFRYPLQTALTVSASLAQIGEFSFILAALGVSLGILPPEAQGLILAGALFSITLNPLAFRTVEPVQRIAQSVRFLAKCLERLARVDAARGDVPVGKLQGHVVLVGYGRVGREIGRALMQSAIPFVVIELSRELVEQLRAQGIMAIHGDASLEPILELAALPAARMLVVATPDALQARRMLEHARKVNPRMDSLVRTHSTEELELLQQAGFNLALMAEKELADRMARYVTDAFKPVPARE